MIRHRCPDWRTRLLAWAQRVRGQPYSWGVTDCATIARAALAEMFGVNVVSVPEYIDRRGALMALRETGGPEAVLDELGAEQVPLSFARAGDLIVTDPDDDSELAGVLVYVDGWCVASTPSTGVCWVPREAVPETSRVYSLWEVTVDG